MMCEQCYEMYKKKQGKEECACPLCKTVGRYIKLKYAWERFQDFLLFLFKLLQEINCKKNIFFLIKKQL